MTFFKQVVAIVKEMMVIIKEGKTRWIPSSLAYYLILSFVPALTIIVVFGFNYFTSLVENIPLFAEMMTSPIFIAIKNYLDNSTPSSYYGVIALLGVSIYLSSNGVMGLMYAINASYSFDKLRYVPTKIASILITALLLISILLVALMTMILPSFIEQFINIDLSYALQFLLLPFLYYIVHFIYYLSALGRLKVNYIYRGALLTTFIIFVSFFGFQIYVTEFSNYSTFYGPVSSIIFSLYFALVMGYAIYYGIVLNLAYYRLNQPETSKESRDLYEIIEKN